MLMSPNKGETAVHGFHCPGDKSMRMREVLARPSVGIFMHLCFKFVYKYNSFIYPKQYL